MRFLLGFFIGALCGAIPLCYGLLTKTKFWAILGIAVTALSGIGFELIGQSPFTSIGVAVVFAVAIFAKNRHSNAHHHFDDHDIYFDDE